MALAAGSCATSKPPLTANELEPLPGGGTVWTEEIDAQAKGLISPPAKIPAFTKFLLGFAERKFKKELPPGRVLTWSTDLGVGSGALELYIEKGAGKILEPRMVYLLRMQVSFAASCPFAIDVNSADYKKYSITEAEIRAMQGQNDIAAVDSFSERERVALHYALAMTMTPPSFSSALLSDVRRLFSHEEIVAIAALSAKVNYWARFIEALRIKSIGYTNDPVLRLEDFTTFEHTDK
jgi:alkylhydroperoxidase family enzyme